MFCKRTNYGGMQKTRFQQTSHLLFLHSTIILNLFIPGSVSVVRGHKNHMLASVSALYIRMLLYKQHYVLFIQQRIFFILPVFILSVNFSVFCTVIQINTLRTCFTYATNLFPCETLFQSVHSILDQFSRTSQIHAKKSGPVSV